MARTYKAMLSGDRVEWIDPPPDRTGPLRVRITVLRDAARPPAKERGQRMAAALDAIARRGGLAGIADPTQWQRETREDRARPGRES